MAELFGILLLVLFGSHAIVEHLLGGYDNNNECKLHKSNHKHIWGDDNLSFDDKTIK